MISRRKFAVLRICSGHFAARGTKFVNFAAGFAHWQGAARALFPNVTAGLKDEKQEVKLATTAAVIRLSVESRNDK